MAKKGPLGITDVTSSESHLPRLVAILQMFSGGPIPPGALAARVGREFSLNSSAVVSRHLRLGERLQLWSRSESLVVSTGKGRALLRLLRATGSQDSFGPPARIIIGAELFSVADIQLGRLVETIDAHEGTPLNAIALAYFRQHTDLPWERRTIRASLESFAETGKVPRLFEHKILAMVGWLRDLGALSSQGSIRLSRAGTLIRHSWDAKAGRFRDSPMRLSAYLAVGTESQYPDPHDSDLAATIIQRIRALYHRHPSGLGMIDFDEASTYISTQSLIEKGVVIDERVFYSLIKTAWRDGLVRSIIVGRSGRPAEIMIGGVD